LRFALALSSFVFVQFHYSTGAGELQQLFGKLFLRKNMQNQRFCGRLWLGDLEKSAIMVALLGMGLQKMQKYAILLSSDPQNTRFRVL
jgi:hypothetical protein